MHAWNTIRRCKILSLFYLSVSEFKKNRLPEGCVGESRSQRLAPPPTPDDCALLVSGADGVYWWAWTIWTIAGGGTGGPTFSCTKSFDLGPPETLPIEMCTFRQNGLYCSCNCMVCPLYNIYSDCRMWFLGLYGCIWAWTWTASGFKIFVMLLWFLAAISILVRFIPMNLREGLTTESAVL